MNLKKSTHLNTYSTQHRGRSRRRRSSLAAAAAIVAMLLSADATAADDAKKHGENFHIGLGAAFNAGGLTVVGNNIVAAPFGGAAIGIPIDIGGVVRLEPELSFTHIANSEDRDNGSSASTHTNVVGIGFGAFYWFTPADSVGAYLGGRLGPSFVFSSASQEDSAGNAASASTSQTNFNIGPAFGAEYYLSPQFCIGAEAQINFTILGDESIEVDPNPGVPIDTEEQGGLIAATNMLLTMRVFLN